VNRKEQTGADLSQREIGLVLRGFSFGQMGRRSAADAGSQVTKRFLVGSEELMRTKDKIWDCGSDGEEKGREKGPVLEEEPTSKADNQFRQWHSLVGRSITD
jgi:hypothetical protein